MCIPTSTTDVEAEDRMAIIRVEDSKHCLFLPFSFIVFVVFHYPDDTRLLQTYENE